MELYKYLSKTKNGYAIVKNNEHFGTYSKLTDALYERDRLVQADWNWDKLMEMEETDNLYEKMSLPPFIHEFSYIQRYPQSYKIYKEGVYLGSFNAKGDAYKFAESVGGEVVESSITHRVVKKIDGKTVYFGQYKDIEDAKKRRDELLKKGWKK